MIIDHGNAPWELPGLCMTGCPEREALVASRLGKKAIHAGTTRQSVNDWLHIPGGRRNAAWGAHAPSLDGDEDEPVSSARGGDGGTGVVTRHNCDTSEA